MTTRSTRPTPNAVRRELALGPDGQSERLRGETGGHSAALGEPSRRSDGCVRDEPPLEAEPGQERGTGL
jgi:hypothetical protein